MSNSKPLPRILVIVGPTASGKSDLALRLAKLAGGKPFKKIGVKGAEIISADSRQIHSGMDIGTAKPELRANGKRLMADGTIHHLINIRNPDQNYTVAEYKRDAVKAIRSILRRGKLPILVGGTGLYARAVIDNLDIPEVKANSKLRKELEERIENGELSSLTKELLRLDPEAANVIDLKNSRRVIRALEVATQTGKPFTAQRQKGKPLFEALEIGVRIPSKKLRGRINNRVEEMLRKGLLEEVRTLLQKYGEVPVFSQTIGYEEIIAHLEGKVILEEAVRQIKMNTWHYARRQTTWFRKNKRIKWVSEPNTAQKLMRRFLKRKTPASNKPGVKSYSPSCSSRSRTSSSTSSNSE